MAITHLLIGSEACSMGRNPCFFCFLFFVNLVKEYMAEEITGPNLEYTAVAWLNG